MTFISTITADSFTGPLVSTLRTTHSERTNPGMVTYVFANGETDAAKMVENVVAIIEKLHGFQTKPRGRVRGPPKVYPKDGWGRFQYQLA